jgi:hypothetical protein
MNCCPRWPNPSVSVPCTFFPTVVLRGSYSFVASPKIAVALATRCPGTQLHRSHTLGPGVPVMLKLPPCNVSYIPHTFLFAASCRPEFGLECGPTGNDLYKSSVI